MLLTFSRHQLMFYSVLKLLIKGTLSYSNKVKNKSTRPLIISSIVSDLYFIPNVAAIIFIIFS